MEFNERLRQIINNNYSSQVQLANDLGVSKVVITKYLNSDRKPNFEMLEKFYNIGYNINWLISGKGTERRYLLNREELDEYDRLIFGFDRVENNSQAVPEKPFYTKDSEISLRENKEVEEHLASAIKRYYYINNSFKVLNIKLINSKYKRYLAESIIYKDKKSFHSQINKPIKKFIENNIEFKGFIPIKITLRVDVNKNKFINYLSTYIFIITELDYYLKSLEQYRNSKYLNQHFLNKLDINKNISTGSSIDENVEEPENNNIQLAQLKERFILLSNIFENESYLESKSLIFTGIIDKIFKIEQS